MARMTLTLRVDPVTKRREVVIDYVSEPDALPMEHEEDHRKAVGKLFAGKVAVSRGGPGGGDGAGQVEAEAVTEREAVPTKG